MQAFSSRLLEGKRVLITGGGSGLGRGVARHLVDHGAVVHLWGRREGVLKEAAEEASAARPGSVHPHTVDVRRFDQVDDTMERRSAVACAALPSGARR
jgi:NAD(P)-dependent dehydrogenase (short-subunit alcohol dehydrogenase family)